jgi:hypothetical protein
MSWERRSEKARGASQFGTLDIEEEKLELSNPLTMPYSCSFYRNAQWHH